MRLAGKKALVTGASRGIGRAIALRFAQEGADIAVSARRVDALGTIAKEVAEMGRNVHCMSWDVRDVPAAATRLAEVHDALGGLDIVVNNAGVLRLPEDHPDPTPEATYDYVLDINLKAVYFICRAAGELMKKQGRGVIVNLASDAGKRAAPHPYGISKWGVIGFTEGLARELAPHGIRVNSVAPGPVATGMMSCPDGKSKDWPAGPLGRYALPEEVAAVALFLASDDSRAVFGQSIVVNSATS